MDKINALFKSHRLRLSVKTPRSGGDAPAGEGHKSAPCTPCLNREIAFGIQAVDVRGSTPRLAHLDCAGSTPRLSTRLDVHSPPVATAWHGVATGHDFDAIDVLDDDEPEFCPAAIPSRHHPDLKMASNEKTRRSRRHRGRERQRSSHRVPSGLDRSWEAHRVEGLEMLQHSIEQRKEQRHCGHDTSVPDHAALAVAAPRDRSKSRSDSNRCLHRVQPAEPVKLPELRVCVERRLLELSHQLAEEKQKSRQDRLSLAKLQQELARHKSEHPLREVLMKELERERRLRIDAENRLRDERLDTCDCKSHVNQLQTELVKAKEFAHSLMLYKGKFERLKEEHASSTMNFQSQLEALQGEVVRLTNENQSLLAEVSRLQKVCSGCRLCSHQNADSRLSVSGASHSDDSMSSGADKTKVLLERLKMLEAEKTCLVLENEKQCEQYEKCLDDITSQVLQALMTQRNLKEECGKLRARVCELERRNAELHEMTNNHAMSGKPTTHADKSLLQEPMSSSWERQQATMLSDLSLNFGSLASMYSDHEQMQCLASRLESPTMLDYDASDTVSSVAAASHQPLSMSSRTSSHPSHPSKPPGSSGSPLNGPPQTTAELGETIAPTIATTEEHTGSTVSLNELLDSFHADDSVALATNDASDIINDWSHSGGGEGLLGNQGGNYDNDDDWLDDIMPTKKNFQLSDVLNHNDGSTFMTKSDACMRLGNGNGNLTANGKAVGVMMSQSADSAMLQRSMTESCTSSSTLASEPMTPRVLDDGYHSNTASVMSPGGCQNISVTTPTSSSGNRLALSSANDGIAKSASRAVNRGNNNMATGSSMPPDVVAGCSQKDRRA